MISGSIFIANCINSPQVHTQGVLIFVLKYITIAGDEVGISLTKKYTEELEERWTWQPQAKLESLWKAKKSKTVLQSQRDIQREANSCFVDRNRSLGMQSVEESTGAPEFEFEEFGDVGEHLEESFQSEAGMFKSYFIYNPV